MAPEPVASRRRYGRWALLGLILVLLGLTGWFAREKWAARAHLERGKAALEADDPTTARSLLNDYLARWPGNAEANFRSAQAARRCGDLAEASIRLDEAARLGWDEAELEMERALIRAQSGDLHSAEPTLFRWVIEERPGSRHVFAVLVPALMAEFRWPEANALAAKWVEVDPQSALSWKDYGETLERLRRMTEAVNAFRKAAERDPEDRHARFSLARLLVETRQSTDEAAAHLEWLRGRAPGDSAVLVQLAACREIQGQTGQAEELLDQVIAAGSPPAKAFYHRGRLELDRGRPAAGVPFLRRASELDPGDLETLYALFQCLRQSGTLAEAREAEERWKRAEADLKRVAELGAAIAASPRDPDLRREMGELFLRNGRERDGVRWLDSAVRERPDHEPSRRLLADYYDRIGDPGLADFHRSFLKSANPKK